MFRWPLPFSRRAVLASALAIATISAAGAATYHRFVVTTSNGGGSGGALEVLQTSSVGGAVQGEVASSADTGFAYPFGVFGIYDGSSSTFGVGVAGTSSTGYGVAGASKGSNAAILAYGGGTGPALQAVTAAQDAYAPAISASVNNFSYADAIDATIGGFGNEVYAISGEDTGVAFNGAGNGGVYGSSAAGEDTTGVTGAGTNGSVGVAATSDTAIAITAYGSTTSASPAPAVYSENGLNASSNNGAGVFAYSGQDPAIAGEMGCDLYLNNVSESGQNCSGLFIQEDGTHGYPLLVYEPNTTQSCSDPKYPFFVNSAGDVYECGTTTTSYVYQRNSNPDSDAVTYAPKQTEATVDDLGSAQLVNGYASVALAADFKQTIDADAAYMVFLTPYGDNRGLYVASRTPNGFVVREAQGGRSSMSFDYRVVARPYGRRLARLPHEAQIIEHRPTDRLSEHKTYAQLIAAAGARNRAAFVGRKRHLYVAPPIAAGFASALRRIKPASTP